jgi:tetratricopeptide (TPR) repeat protein
MKRPFALAALVAALSLAGPARADVVDEAFARGNAAAAAGDLQAAVSAYEEAERLLPGRSALLSFDLGTAYAQLGEVGLATYHLRRALQGQAQASEEVAAAAQRNLGIVRQRLEIAAAAAGAQVDRPETWRDALLAAVGSPGFGWLALGAGWLALLVWLLRGRLGGRAPGGVVGSVIGVLVAIYLVVGGLHGYAVRAESEAPQAIALPAKLEVREGPGTHRKALFVVQGGSRVRIVDRGSGWLRIRLPDGLEGWAPQVSLGELGGEVPRPGSLVRDRTP